MFALALAAPAAGAQQAPPAASSWAAGPLAVQAGVDTYTAYYAMRGAWWNLAAETAPSFDADRSFGEVWLHPKASATHALGGAQQAYGALSVGITRTIGADAFDEDGQGAVRFENAHLGLRGSTDGGWSHDLSFGRQPFTLGTGMLLTAGSSNGGSWGGAASTPRKAWGRSVLARVGHGELTGQAFVLEPSESPEVKTDTRVQGVSIEWAREQSGKAGLAWLTVPKSNAVYPGDLAPLAFIEDGRNGLDTWHGWADVAGLVPGLRALSLRAEFAVQSNDVTRVDGSTDPMRAEAWLIGVGYQARSLPFAPRFRYHLARFSGDKPGTDTYERFDPMFWGNGLDNWWFGANGAYAWLNSNIRAHRFIVDAYASAQDILQFQFIRASADQLGSAIQYGQGARFDGSPLVVGVPAEALADEYYLQWAHVFTPTLVAVAFVSRSLPGDGLKAVAPQGSSSWTTFGLGLTANF
jgi:hypothetical protein